MKRIFIPIFVAVLFFGAFGFVSLTKAAVSVSIESVEPQKPQVQEEVTVKVKMQTKFPCCLVPAVPIIPFCSIRWRCSEEKDFSLPDGCFLPTTECIKTFTCKYPKEGNYIIKAVAAGVEGTGEDEKVILVEGVPSGAVCGTSFVDAKGKTPDGSAQEWCGDGMNIDCVLQSYDFCKEGKHYHFGCKDILPGPLTDCRCDDDPSKTPAAEKCSEYCQNWSWTKEKGTYGGVCCNCTQWENKKCRGLKSDGVRCKEVLQWRSCSLKPDGPCAVAEQCDSSEAAKKLCHCGNGVIDYGEKCDPGDSLAGLPERLGGKTCKDVGSGDGPGLKCYPSYDAKECSFDDRACPTPSVCGDGNLNSYTEKCEKNPDTGKFVFPSDKDICQEVDSKYTSGTLGCNAPTYVGDPNGCSFDLSGCSTLGSDGGDDGGGWSGIFEIENPLTATTVTELIDRIINFIWFLAIVFAPIMFLIGGFTFLTSGGDPQKVSKGKNIMIYAAVGLAIVLVAKGIIALLKDILGVKPEEAEPTSYFQNFGFFAIIGLESIKKFFKGRK